MLLMSSLLYVTHWLLYSATFLRLPDNLKLAFNYVRVALFILLHVPVTGWVAESWLGRYRAIAVGLVLSSVTIQILQAAFVMLQFDWTLIPAFVVIVAGSVIGTLGFGSFILQCNLDYPDSFVSPKNCRCEIVRITKIKMAAVQKVA